MMRRKRKIRYLVVEECLAEILMSSKVRCSHLNCQNTSNTARFRFYRPSLRLNMESQVTRELLMSRSSATKLVKMLSCRLR